MTWGMVSDSSCDLSSQAFQGMGLHFAVVPLKINVGGTEYVDDDSLDVNEMLAQMKRYSGPSSTACPAPESWAQEFRRSDCTLAVTMTSALSGTYNSAVTAKNMVLEEYPGKKIHIIDSRSTAGGLVLILRKAAALIQSGCSFDEIVEQTEDYADGLSLLFALGSYDNLIKTGRMSRVAGILATTLHIRAVASNTAEGTIQIMQKPRGEERAIRAIAELMQSRKDLKGQPVVVSHCNNPNGAHRLKEMIAHTSLTSNISIQQTRGLTSFYTGDGGLLAAF